MEILNLSIDKNTNVERLSAHWNKNENIIKYITNSKKTIDRLLVNNEHKNAFELLILVLGRLDGEELQNFIKYYDEYIFTKHIDSE